jgi:hypothetical protein
MNGRTLKVLAVIAGILALGEFGDSVMIWKENYPGSLPMAAVVFGVFFLIAVWLLRSGRVTAGAIFAGLLCLFEVVSVPGYTRHNVWDWITQIAFGLVSLAGLIAAIMVLAARLRSRATA